MKHAVLACALAAALLTTPALAQGDLKGALETYRASAPIALRGGASKSSLPRRRRTALLPASQPIATDSTYPSTPVICPAKKRFEAERICMVAASTRGAFI